MNLSEIDRIYLYGKPVRPSAESVESVLQDFDTKSEAYEAAYRLWTAEEQWWKQIEDLLP